MVQATDIEALKQRIHQLQIEHRDLDDVISRLSQSPAQDQLQLQRLKKRKLYLKDQIAMLERQLEPDIPA
ncbi:MAG TPA: YdcH family protein [Burkholderiales bacterium]|nr:YdcH family protein [Burkholderiales bacterium]